MNKTSINPIVFFATGICIAALPILVLYFFNTAGAHLTQAEQLYSDGENGKTIAERAGAFNKTLSIYNDLEKRYAPFSGNGKLFYNIGNTYFQLGEYPLAIFYYRQAQILMPRSEKVAQNLKLALSKAGLPLSSPSSDSVFSTLFVFHYFLSLPERFQVFAASALFAILLASLFVWLQWRIFKILTGILLLISIVFFFSICYSKYLEPTEAVVIQFSNLYRDAGDQYAKAQNEPVPAGAKVEVLAIQKRGVWVKVLTQDGTLGYLPQKSLRLLQN